MWRWPVPSLKLFTVHAVSHRDGRLIALQRTFLFHLLQHVDDMLWRAVIESSFGPTVSLPELGRTQFAAIHDRCGHIVRLNVKRGPAEISGGDEARIGNRPKLKRE